MKGRNVLAGLVGAAGALFGDIDVDDVEAALTSNRWQVGNGKWEDGANWTAGVPSSDDAVNIIASIFPSITTIDTATVTQHVINGCMTISNLVVGGLTTHQLFLNNANNTPGNIGLTILNSFTITSSGSLSVTNSDLKVLGSSVIYNDGTILLNSGSMIITQFTGLVFVGNTGEGTLTVSNGTLRVGFMEVPRQAIGTRGTLNIAGGTSFFKDLTVGIGPTGTVWMTGGQLTVSVGTNSFGGPGPRSGEMIVSNGAWSAGLVLFHTGGTLTVAGGTNNLTVLRIGEFSGDTGTVWVTGGQLSVTNNLDISILGSNRTVVGNSGIGQLTVSNGTFLARELYVGTNTGSQGTFTVAGGTNMLTSTMQIGSRSGATGAVWITDGLLVVTNAGTTVGSNGVGQVTQSNGTWRTLGVVLGLSTGSGTLTIAGGTNFSNGGLDLGMFVPATGAVWVTGGALLATNSGATVGDNGKGQLTVSNGVFRTQNVVAGSGSAASGTLTFAGGTTDLAAIFLGSNSSICTGTVWLTGGELLNPNGTFIGLNGVGRMTTSNGTWHASTVIVAQNAGSKGTLNVNGGTNLLSGMIIGSAACTSTGIVNVTDGETYITNVFGNARIDVRSGTVTVSGGLLVVDQIIVTNACGRFIHTGGTLLTGTNILTATFDADGDGIPNGIDPNLFNPIDGADPDGDGFTNFQESQAGTDPTNSASAFRISAITREANNIRVTWMSGIGKTNALQRTAGTNGSFATNAFAAIFTVTNTVGTVTNYLDVGADTNFPARYYRVRLVP
jgi:T5SS/PEP-CTERM-associated repeat protein